MQRMVEGLRALHVDEARILYEAFGPSNLPRAGARQFSMQVADPAADVTPAVAVAIHPAHSDSDLVWDSRDASLDLAEAHGLPAHKRVEIA